MDGPTAYLSGNQKALVSYFAYPKSIASEIGLRWVRIPSSDPGYATVATDATLPSALSDIKPSGRLIELPAGRLDGKSVVGIRGKMPHGQGAGTDTIYVTRSAHPLPVAAMMAGSGNKVTATFSHWGEHVAAAPPAHWIAASAL